MRTSVMTFSLCIEVKKGEARTHLGCAAPPNTSLPLISASALAVPTGLNHGSCTNNTSSSELVLRRTCIAALRRLMFTLANENFLDIVMGGVYVLRRRPRKEGDNWSHYVRKVPITVALHACESRVWDRITVTWLMCVPIPVPIYHSLQGIACRFSAIGQHRGEVSRLSAPCLMHVNRADCTVHHGRHVLQDTGIKGGRGRNRLQLERHMNGIRII